MIRCRSDRITLGALSIVLAAMACAGQREESAATEESAAETATPAVTVVQADSGLRLEPRANPCDARTDQFQVRFAIDADGGRIGLCEEHGEPMFDEEGDVGPSAILRVFAFFERGDSGAVFVGKDQPLYEGMSPDIEVSELGQSYTLHWIWFSSGNDVHVFESCVGGYRICPLLSLRYVRFSGGRLVTDETCAVQEGEVCNVDAVDETFIAEDSTEDHSVLSSRPRQQFIARDLPTELQRQLETGRFR